MGIIYALHHDSSNQIYVGQGLEHSRPRQHRFP